MNATIINSLQDVVDAKTDFNNNITELILNYF